MTDGEETNEEHDSNIGKYPEACSVCNKAPSDKKWLGRFFHKKCLRKLRKGAKGMF